MTSTQLDDPIQLIALEALQFGLLNRINPQDGYYNDMDEGEVNLFEKSHSDRKKFPSIDLIWDVNRMTNSVSGGHSHGGFNHITPIFLEGVVKESDNPMKEQLRLKADIEKYFGIFFKLEDENDQATIFNSVIDTVRFFGMKQNQPFVGVDFRVLLYFRTEQENPAQNF